MVALITAFAGLVVGAVVALWWSARGRAPARVAAAEAEARTAAHASIAAAEAHADAAEAAVPAAVADAAPAHDPKAGAEFAADFLAGRR